VLAGVKDLVRELLGRRYPQESDGTDRLFWCSGALPLPLPMPCKRNRRLTLTRMAQGRNRYRLTRGQ
jgi:hypothetical protein